MRLRALLENDALGLRLLGGEDELDRGVRGVMTTDLRDPSRYLSGGELVLTGLAWRHSPKDSEPFVRILVQAQVAGLAAGEAELGAVPDDLVAACARHRLPLFAVHESVAFATITEYVVRQVSGERAGDLAAVVDRHRRLMTSGPTGGGPEVVLDLLGSDLDLRAWVLSPTGRQIAGPSDVSGVGGASGAGGSGGTGGAGVTSGTATSGSTPVTGGAGATAVTESGAREAGAPLTTESTAHRTATGAPLTTKSTAHQTATGAPLTTESTAHRTATGAPLTTKSTAHQTTAGALPAEVSTALAGEHLSATRAGHRPPHRTTVAGTVYSLFPVQHADRAAAPGSHDVRESVLSDWLLAVEADAGDWPSARLDLLQGVTQLIAVERDRRDAARTVRRRLAQEVLELVQTGAAPAEVSARLRVAAPVLLPGLDTAPHWQIVVARVDWGPDAAGVDAGAVAQALLEEVLVDPAAAGADASDRFAVAHAGDEAVALVPLSALPPVGDSPASAEALHADALLAAVREPLSAGLGDDGRLTIGASAAVSSAEGLRGALEEARHARRVAAARPGRVCAAGHHELASHVLLLPFVPDDVRRAFTARLLDPLRDYDRRHRAELIPTLEAFLESDGSWTRCAARLHLHVNTLRYRVGRIEQLTGRDLSRLEDKLDFFLALRMG
ncbi:PucR family transcriptional regulator ligand-binding domain-containing protein [Streptomyces sp. NPDC047315]|uniref:PucR family transcriptional regulator ligand-binding domain-containing protein n=1 Tax=Streptomyces sp. NPDC047315 TaxID=3155142 RepID=UPI0033C42F2D